jgi:hypothetical protein
MGDVTMRLRLWEIKEKKELKSFLLVFVLVAASMLIIIPMETPQVSAIVHAQSAAFEDWDGIGPPNQWDMDPTPFVVEWDPNDDHEISHINGYLIEAGYTLNIPALNYQTGNPSENMIIFSGLSSRRMDVYGTLITNFGSLMPPTWTAFTGTGGWDGIYFHAGSTGRFYGCKIIDAWNGVVFEPGSSLMAPGITYTDFDAISDHGLRMDGVSGSTNLEFVQFDDLTVPSATSLDIRNGSLDMENVFFLGHGADMPAMRIDNATVNGLNCQVNGLDEPGVAIDIGPNSDGTVLDTFAFLNGASGDYYIQVNGSDIVVTDSTFDITDGQQTMIANDFLSDPSDSILRNPNPPGTTFDNTTINPTDGSSITLQWYMDVYAEDPDGNPIDNAFVTVKDRLGTPAQPPSMSTDLTGWARDFIIAELIKYNNTATYFNPFTVTAENNSMTGYAYPSLNMSQEVIVIVPFNPTPNAIPFLTFIQTPGSVVSGPVSIPFMLDDPNPGDDGNLSIEVEFSFTGIPGDWVPATVDPSSDPTSGLNVNTLYTFVWDSTTDRPGEYNTTVYIRIIPSDRIESGAPTQTAAFTLDNKPPDLVTPVVCTPSDTSALFEWEVDEAANASVWWGQGTMLQTVTVGSTGSPIQSVTVTGLQPGRFHTYAVISTDQFGNEYMSTTYTFETEIHIQLKKGWNMISIPPYLTETDIDLVLAPIDGKYDAVESYYAFDVQDPWKHYLPGKGFGNDLLWLDHVNGSTWSHGSHFGPTLHRNHYSSGTRLEFCWISLGCDPSYR